MIVFLIEITDVEKIKKLSTEEHKSIKLGYAYHVSDTQLPERSVDPWKTAQLHLHQCKISTEVLILKGCTGNRGKIPAKN